MAVVDNSTLRSYRGRLSETGKWNNVADSISINAKLSAENNFTDKQFIGDTANANMTLGLTINQGAADDQALTLKSSDVSHGLTTATVETDVETDDFLSIAKRSATSGGVAFQAMAEDAGLARVLTIEAYGGTGGTDATTTSQGLIQFFASEHDGANALVNAPTNQNLFAVRAQVSGSQKTHFLIKGDDGEIFGVNTAMTAFDDEDDIQVVRQLQIENSHGKGIIQTEYDKPVYNFNALRRMGVVGPKDERESYLISFQSYFALHDGAIWQLYLGSRKLQQALSETMKRLSVAETKLAALPAP